MDMQGENACSYSHTNEEIDQKIVTVEPPTEINQPTSLRKSDVEMKSENGRIMNVDFNVLFNNNNTH